MVSVAVAEAGRVVVAVVEAAAAAAAPAACAAGARAICGNPAEWGGGGVGFDG